MGYIYTVLYGVYLDRNTSLALNWFAHDRIQALYQYAGLWFVYYI